MIPAGGLGPSVSAAFSYAKSSYHQDETDPTPTITGTTGGTFSATPSGLSINASTGTIDLSASTIQPYTITYTVDGVSANFSLGVTASPFIANTFSMQFDGVDDYVFAGSMPDLNNVTQFSISGWYKFDNTSRLEVLCANGGSLGGNNYNFLLQHWPSNNVSAFIASSLTDSGSNYVKTNNNFITSTSEWYHITVVYDGSLSTNTDKAKIYVNGIDVTVNGAGTIASSTTNTSGSFNIGQWEGIGRYFDGKIDEVAIWNTALGETAIQEIYNATNNNTGKALDLSTDYNNYTSSSNLQYWNRLGD